MRIGLVSTYPPIECGIATYSQFLVEGLENRGNEVYIFSERGGKGDRVFAAYSSKRDDIAANIFLTASKMTPDVLHIQHEFGLYGEPKGIQIIELILRCRVAGLPVVTTFHTVHETLTNEEKVVMRVIVQESANIIVHDDQHREILEANFGQTEKISVIPHGIREVAEVDNAKSILDISGKKAIVLCGYLRETKRFDRIVKAFPQVAEEVENVVLVIAGKSRSVDHPEYQKKLYQMVEDSPAADKIIVLHGQFPQHIFDTILSAADVVSLPYEIGAQSGIMAHCFAFRKPVVTSNLRAFRNWIEESGGGLVAEKEEDFAKHLIRILNDDPWRESLRRNIAKFVAEKASWRIVAGRHVEIYEKCIEKPTAGSRYFG